VIWLPAIVATSVLDDAYEKVPGADDVGAAIACDCPCVPLIAANPLSVGTVNVVPPTDMRKLFERAVHVAPPSDDAIERNVGAGATSVVGAVSL
jgi:hypothetical protein